MTIRLSRRKLARYTAERILVGDSSIIAKLAALIVEERREREIDLLVLDVEEQLASRGLVVATVESATSLSEALRQSVIGFLGGDEMRLREVVRPELIGGVRIASPTQEFDGTIAKKLYELKSRKI